MVTDQNLFAAREAAAAGELAEWLVAVLRTEPGANRSLAAMIVGQRPILEGPIQVELESLERIAGPGPEFKYPKEPEQWEVEVAPFLKMAQEEVPPLIIRETAGRRHLSDGSHRVDAWRRRGETHGWAVIWRDRDPGFDGWWGPFLPSETPAIRVVKQVGDFLPAVETEGTILAAVLEDRVVGAVRLVPEFGDWTLRTLRVDEAFRGRRLGARLLHHLGSLMEGKTVFCLAYPWLSRFYGEFGFRPVEPAELSLELRARYEEYQDEKGCLALRRGL